MVYDVESTNDLMKAADEFLNSDGRSQMSKTSVASSKILENKRAAKGYNPYKVKLLQDKLDAKGKERLAELMAEIDSDLPNLMKEKQEYYKHAGKRAFKDKS